jgi:hypothetical protein
VSPFDEHFSRLARLGRRAPAEAAPAELPLGLATRVLARLRADAPEPVSPWEFLSLRVLPLAVCVAAACLVDIGSIGQAPAPDEPRLAQLIVQAELAP